MHQDDDAFVWFSRNKPAMHYCTAGTWKLNRFNRQISRLLSNFAIAWGDQNISFMPGKQSKGESSNRGKASNKF
jgi:hypothetical protein